jgi:hypothetical protein
MVDSRTTFVAGCASTADVDDFNGSIITDQYGFDIIEANTPIGLPSGKTLSFNKIMYVHQVPDGWETWDGEHQPLVLQPLGGLSVIGTFSAPVPAFGMEVAVDPSWDITLDLDDDSSPLTQSVSDDSGAKFFGYLYGVNINSFTVSGNTDFAIGRMIEGTPIPVPGSLLLLGSGLMGLGLMGWRRRG